VVVRARAAGAATWIVARGKGIAVEDVVTAVRGVGMDPMLAWG
jgi:hypothetical protein